MKDYQISLKITFEFFFYDGCIKHNGEFSQIKLGLFKPTARDA